jgi:hypothetical protein
MLRMFGKNIKPSALLLASLLTLFFTWLTVGARYSHLIRNQAWRLTGKTSVLNYCELVQNKELFHNTMVHFQARIGADNTGFFLYGCSPGIEANLTKLILEDEMTLSEEAKQWLKQLREQEKETWASSGAWFTGEFDAYLSPGCWGPAFGLKVVKIEQLEPISLGREGLNGVPIEKDAGGPSLRRYH